MGFVNAELENTTTDSRDGPRNFHFRHEKRSSSTWIPCAVLLALHGGVGCALKVRGFKLVPGSQEGIHIRMRHEHVDIGPVRPMLGRKTPIGLHPFVQARDDRASQVLFQFPDGRSVADNKPDELEVALFRFMAISVK